MKISGYYDSYSYTIWNNIYINGFDVITFKNDLFTFKKIDKSLDKFYTKMKFINILIEALIHLNIY